MAEDEERIAEFIRLEAPEDKLRIVCDCVKRCYEAGLTTAVRLSDRRQAGLLDELLWTFEDQAFIPHVLGPEAKQPVLEPVAIWWGSDRPWRADALVEAAGSEPPDWLGDYRRLFDFAEVYDEELRERSRRRYKACQEAGFRMRYVS